MRLLDRLIRRAGYWEGLASGAAVLTTSYGSPDREAILPQVAGWAQEAFGSNSVVFSAILNRLMLFSEARFALQAKDDKHLFTSTSLALLQKPFGGGTSSGELLVRMEQDASLAGNAYIWGEPGGELLVRLRPDWTTIVSELVQVPGGGAYRRKLGYWTEPPRGVNGQGHGEFYPAEEVAHWAPIPDPQATFRGMSWLTPAYRDVLGDQGMVTHKIRYLENAASPNLLIRYAQKLHPSTIDGIRERTHARYGGAANAFKTLILDQGADATVIGNSLQQMDFSVVGAAGEQRILADSMVPGVLVGLEPLRGAGRGYQESMQKFANLWGRPSWRSACAVLERFVPGLPGGARLWFDTSDIAALQDGELERGQAALVRAQAVLTSRQAGYTHDSCVAFVNSGDVTQLKADPLAAAPQGNVQHMLPQQQPGATADPLPAGTQARLPISSTSPGDGGNGTRPGPLPAAGRRMITVGAGGSRPFRQDEPAMRAGPEGYVHGWIKVGPGGPEAAGTAAYEHIRNGDLSDASRRALSDYQQQGYRRVNRYLDRGADPSGRAAADVHELDDAMKDARVTAPAVTVRGITQETADLIFGAPGSMKGRTFTDKRFGSTSVHSHVALRFAGFGGGTLIFYHLRDGDVALKLNDALGSLSDAPDEEEILLGRGQRWRVIKDARKGPSGLREIHLESAG